MENVLSVGKQSKLERRLLKIPKRTGSIKHVLIWKTNYHDLAKNKYKLIINFLNNNQKYNLK